MSMRVEVSKEVTVALKARDKVKAATLRLLLCALQNKEKELKRELDKAEGEQIVATLLRQRNESVEQFRNGGREELALKEEAEIVILKAYLPPQLSKEEVLAVVKAKAAELGATSMKEMGAVMKAVMSELKGRAEGKLINETVKEVLGS